MTGQHLPYSGSRSGTGPLIPAPPSPLPAPALSPRPSPRQHRRQWGLPKFLPGLPKNDHSGDRQLAGPATTAGMPAARATHPARRSDAGTIKLTDRDITGLAAAAAGVLSLLVLALIPGQASGPAVVTGLVIWFVFSARADLAPPPGR